jgi:type VI secretion system secreted protein VgrG
MPPLAHTQDKRYLRFDSPAGKDKLIPVGIEGEEEISALFRLRLELTSAEPALDFKKLVGKGATLTVIGGDGAERHLHGLVVRFVQGGCDASAYRYVAELRPWLWLLGRAADCRVFQNLTVPEILAEVFNEHGQRDFRNACKKTYEKREYCVQYNETALAFVSRLMEEEGIFYYFEHAKGSHTLVLADDADAFARYPGGKAVDFESESEAAWNAGDVVTACEVEETVVAEAYAVDDFNFETPSTALEGKVGDGKRAIYEYPGGVETKSQAEKRARLRIEQEELDARQLKGESLCRGFSAGMRFELAKHFRADLNGAWVIRKVFHAARPDTYVNQFEALPAATPFRTPRRTPRPRIAGSQTAIVVGPEGKEIWTDKYGRIKIQFHWDRRGAKDDKSSLWIRVAQGWAGKGWGAFFLPRVGQEVVVGFLDGDPDRPLVTGAVYNAQQTVPYALPDNATRSTIKSRSAEQAEGFNELRFEDRKDEEEVYLHAQKDLNIEVEENRTTTVGADDEIKVKNDRSVLVEEGDEKLEVLLGDRSITVTEGDETHDVGGERKLGVTGKETHENKDDFEHTVDGNYVLTIKGNLTIEVTGDIKLKSSRSVTTEAGQSLLAKAGTSLTNEAGTSLTNKSGTALANEAGTSMTNNAQMSMTNKAGMSLTNEGGMSIVNKGGMTNKIEGTMVTVEASAIAMVKGALVKLN